MVQNRPQPSLEELAVRAKTAAIRAKNDSHSCEDKDEPKKNPFMRWVIFLFFKRKINNFNWINWKGKITSIYKDSDESEINILDVYCPPEVNNPLPSEKLIAFIKEDPEGLFANTLFNKNPKASFQIILLKKGEEGKSWKEIVEELKLGKTHGPVFTFYRRCCEKFAPYFRKYLNLEVNIKSNKNQSTDECY